MKVKDNNGNIMEGIVRNSDGSLCVNDKIGLNKYRMQKQLQEQQKTAIESLQDQVATLTKLVESLLKEKQ